MQEEHHCHHLKSKILFDCDGTLYGNMNEKHFPGNNILSELHEEPDESL